jgi:hypothetical protein
VQRVALRLAVEARKGRAWLDRVDDDAVVDDPQSGDVRGLGKGCGDLLTVAELEIDDQIAGDVVIELQDGSPALVEDYLEDIKEVI